MASALLERIIEKATMIREGIPVKLDDEVTLLITHPRYGVAKTWGDGASPFQILRECATFEGERIFLEATDEQLLEIPTNVLKMIGDAANRLLEKKDDEIKADPKELIQGN